MKEPQFEARAHTRDAVLVLRLWREQHDPRARARLLANASEPADLGEPLIGAAEIVAAVAEKVRAFERRDE